MKEKPIKYCHYCSYKFYEKDIKPNSQLGKNCNYYGFYIICPKCGNTNVIKDSRYRRYENDR